VDVEEGNKEVEVTEKKYFDQTKWTNRVIEQPFVEVQSV